MHFIAALQEILIMALVSLFLVMIIFGGVYYYLVKVRKINSSVEKLNYSTFNKKDPMEYIKFNDIVSEGDNIYEGMGMIACGNTYISGIEVTGYNYKLASTQEQRNTMIAMIGFINQIETPIQIRQSTKAIDLQQNIDDYEQIKKNLARELENLNLDKKELCDLADDLIDDPGNFNIVLKKLDKIETLQFSKEKDFKEVNALIRWMNMYSDTSIMETQKVQTIHFSYVYNPDKFLEELTEEEVRIHALRELNSKAQSYGAALRACSCSFKPCSAATLIDLFRKHYSPLSADDIQLENLFNSSYNTLFVSSNSLIELQKELRGEERFEKELEEYQNQLNETLNKQALARERSSRILMQYIDELLSTNAAKGE